MKGVTIIKDEATNKRYVQIELELLDKDPEELQDLIDTIIAESRKNEESFTLEEVTAHLKNIGKL